VRDAVRTTCFHHAVATDVDNRLAELAERYALPEGAPEQLAVLLDLVATEPSAITTVRDPAKGVDLHVADSLVALELPQVPAAQRIADLGSGAGFPGLVLAIALPNAHVALVESVGRKCAFMRGASERLGVANAEVVQSRAEAWPQGIAMHDLVTARALAPLTTLVEYAAPLLVVGGALVSWKGAVHAGEEADGQAAAAALGMSAPVIRAVKPFAGAREHKLYVYSKVMATPSRYPRREGMARKRPIRVSS
jgi:16S rRNA (guanine527-N7)-methyltransferase